MNSTEETIFNEALDKLDPQERSAYLDQACAGDAALKSRIEQLVSAYGEGEFLEFPAPGLAQKSYQDPMEQVGTRIGPYKLLQQIGEGGMGVVYMAEQTEPVQRRVALKIIKPGMDTRQVIGRFEAERQALALMDHPNIAKVLDAGTTNSGRPFFVMDLIKGVPITKYCDEKHFSLRERLELLIPVCQAIQHAHQKGIIHRDIKPTNVLIAQYDGRPVPKVIDFGVAKATAQKLTERTMFTELGQIVGTLEYMSPEQAELNQLDIDTRSDIYSLGVLLYELLTGSTPLEKHKLRSAAFDEMLRLIREEEPEKPSTRLSRVGSLHFGPRGVRISSAKSKNDQGIPADTAAHTDTSHGQAEIALMPCLASIAAVRSIEPARLAKLIRGELDWVVMKTLDKDRARRYASAADLAADLSRYLNNDTVQAYPPSAWYRFRKFARRNRLAFTAATIVAIALIAGTAVSTWQAIRASRAELLAEAKASEARSNEQKALTAEKKAVAAATAEAEQLRRAVEQTRIVETQRQRLQSNERLNALVTGQVLSVVRDIPASKTQRQALLATVLRRLKELDPADRVKAFQIAGNLFVTLHDFPAAIAAFDDGLSLDPKDVALLVGRGDVYFRQKQFEKAAADYTCAIESRPAKYRGNEVHRPYARRGFARCQLNDFHSALNDFQASYEAQPAATLLMLGYGFRDSFVTQIPNAPFDPRLQQGINALFDRYVAEQKQSEKARIFCAETLGMLKQYDRARGHLEVVLAAGTTSYGPYNSLAVLALELGDRDAYRKVCAAMLTQSAVVQDEDFTSYTAWCCGLGPGALDDYGPIIKTARGSLAEQPANEKRLLNLGVLLLRAGQYEEARESLARAVETRYSPENVPVFGGYYLAMAHHYLGHIEEAQRTLETASQPVRSYYSWRFQAQLHLIREEAQQLIGQKTTDNCAHSTVELGPT